MDEVSRLQRHLPLIRSCAGWTAAALGEKLGVKRQTISTIEQGEAKYKMTRMQYLAIRKVLDDEINTAQEETQMLATILDALVDHPEQYTNDERTEILANANLLAPAIVKNPANRKKASLKWIALVAGSGVIASAALMALIGHKKN